MSLRGAERDEAILRYTSADAANLTQGDLIKK